MSIHTKNFDDFLDSLPDDLPDGLPREFWESLGYDVSTTPFVYKAKSPSELKAAHEKIRGSCKVEAISRVMTYIKPWKYDISKSDYEDETIKTFYGILANLLDKRESTGDQKWKDAYEILFNNSLKFVLDPIIAEFEKEKEKELEKTIPWDEIA